MASTTTTNNCATVNNNNNNCTTEEEGKYSIACRTCRQSHLCCDKTMPSCLECKNRGKECIYEKPKRRGRPPSGSTTNNTNSTTTTKGECKKKIKSIHSDETLNNNSNRTATTSKNNRNCGDSTNSKGKKYHPYEVVSESKVNNSKKKTVLGMDDDLIRNNYKLETIDLFYEVIDPGFDLFTIQEMKQFLNMTSTLDENSGIKAMLYSIQALCEQRLANGKRSELAAQESRRNLMKSDYNLFTKIGYALLIEYLGGEGQDELALSYLGHLNKLVLEGTEIPHSFKNLMFKAVKTCNTIDMEYGGIVSNLATIYSSLFGEESKKKHPHFDLDSISRGVNALNAEQAVQMVQSMKDLMSSKLSITIQNGKRSNFYIKMKTVWQELMFLSGLSSIFFSLGLEGPQVDHLIEKADKLMEDFSAYSSPVLIFPFLSIYMSYRVKHFENVLFEFQEKLVNGMDVRSIFCEEKLQKYFHGVVQYLKVFNDFSQRYKRIEKHFGKLHQDLNMIARWKFLLQMPTLPQYISDEVDSTATTQSVASSVPTSCNNSSGCSSSFSPNTNSGGSLGTNDSFDILTELLITETTNNENEESEYRSCLEKSKLLDSSDI